MFISDIKRMARSRSVQVLFLVLAAVMVLDPISIKLLTMKFPDIYSITGTNPYQFWLLINSAGWGNQVYDALFWVIPVLVSGSIYWNEQHSSIAIFLIIKNSRKKYYCSKILSTFIFSFCFLFSLLCMNLIVTYTCFSLSSPITKQYEFLIPTIGTYAYELYEISPFGMSVFFSFINALAISILAVFSMATQALVKISNKYIALVFPVIAIFAVTFVFDAIPALHGYDLKIIIQPRASTSMTHLITQNDFERTLLGWCFITIVLLWGGYLRNEDML